MLVLALDTAMAACSAALVDGAGLPSARALAARTDRMERGHAEALLPLVEHVMGAGGRVYADLDLIVATVGPGAFTGIRIGLAAARGLALAASKPCAGVTTLEAIAAAAKGRPTLVCVESRREDLFAQAFAANGSALSAPASVSPAGLAAFAGDAGLAPGFVLAGDGALRASVALATALPSAGLGAEIMDMTTPDPILVAGIAASRHGTADALAPRPLYLRPPDVTLPKKA